MATFHDLRANYGSKHGPTYRVRMEARSHPPREKCEMNFRNNLTAFSWKALLEWKSIQEGFKGRRIMAPGGIAFAASQFVFAGYSGAPFSNRAFNLRLRAACRALGVGRSPRMGCATPRPRSSLTMLERICGKSRNSSANKNMRTTVRYTHVGYEQTRQTAEALSRALE